jgi:uncharacterized repeat protein (TIGR03803 family)
VLLPRARFDEEIPMKKSLLTLTHALAFATITFSLAVCAQAQTITYLSGQGISAPVNPTMFIQATDGNFYSEAFSAFHQNGYIYRMTPSGATTIIHTFCTQSGCADGDQPIPPILGSDGNLYGVTTAGGNSSLTGTIYKLTLSGEFTQLYSFCANPACPDGQHPVGIVEGRDGNFYGVTQRGGVNDPIDGGAGTIFSISPSGQFKLLYSFCSQANCADGEEPPSAPILGDDGNFYGVAQFGGTGTGAPGVAYKLTSSGVYSVIYNFCSATHCIDGAQPLAVTQGPHSTLFGITYTGGTRFCGTAFRIGPNNSYQVLHRFSDADLCNPFNALTLANDGNFYDVLGPQSGGGLIFQLTPEGGFTTLYDFSGQRGTDPAGMLFQGTDGNFYGGTLLNADACCTGAVFRFSTGLSPLVQTVPTAGKVGKQIIILGNHLTGTTGVTFNGVQANFTIESDTYIQATVPAGASTGTVSVVTPSGTLDGNPQFVVTK